MNSTLAGLLQSRIMPSCSVKDCFRGYVIWIPVPVWLSAMDFTSLGLSFQRCKREAWTDWFLRTLSRITFYRTTKGTGIHFDMWCYSWASILSEGLLEQWNLKLRGWLGTWNKWLPSWRASRRLYVGKFRAIWMSEDCNHPPVLQEPAFRRRHYVTW